MSYGDAHIAPDITHHPNGWSAERTDREVDDERRAVAFDGLDLDASAHRADAVVDDREAEADAVDLETVALLDARKAGEDRRDRLLRNADAVIGHAETTPAVRGLPADLDVPLGLRRIRIFDRVRQ